MAKNINRLQTKYLKEVMPLLMSEFAIKNSMAVPKIVKVVVNSGVGDSLKNKENLENSKKDIAQITGQMPSVRKARVSVASFGIRAGMPVGLKSTLRGEKMYSFLDRLISIVLPRLRDFRGVSANSFDKEGNYTLGITERSVFPEIDQIASGIKGCEVTIVTNTKDLEKSKKLLELMGLPFEKGK